MTFEYSILFIVFLGGLTRGLIFFLVATGLTLVFGVLNVVNFAHGTLYMMGAFLCYTITGLLMGNRYAFWLALVIAPIVTAFIGGLIEFFILRRIYKREHASQLLVTFALILVLQDIAKMVWGGHVDETPKPEILMGSISIMGSSFPKYYLFVILLSILVGIGLWLLLSKTRWGMAIRASACDVEMAGATGIKVPRLFTLVFMLGVWMAGIGGAVYAPIGYVGLGFDLDMVIICFIIIIIGGAGNIWGCAISALIIGLVDSFGALLLPRFTLVFIYVIMAVVLITRPQGLLGGAGR